MSAYGIYLFGLEKKEKKRFSHKFLLSLVLLAMLLKCFKYKTNIPKENLISYQKKKLAQEMRLENWVSHKHLYPAENAWPDLGGRSRRPRGPSKC